MQDAERFLSFLPLAERTRKPRETGLTMVGDRGWPLVFIEGMLEAYGHAVDIVKISAWHLHQPEKVVKRKVETYKRHHVEVQIGGPVLEIARAVGQAERTLQALRDLGFDSLEISSEALPTQHSMDEDARFAELCCEYGFTLYGEVGKKFPEGDQTRLAADTVNVEETVRQMKAYLAAGCRKVYWEGHILRRVLGDAGERPEGAAQLLAVAEQVGADNIIFEVPFTYLPYAGKRALQAWLVHLFGPNVNIGNVLIEELPELEEIRGGTFPAFGAPCGDHPWLHSLVRGRGTAAPRWWQE
ncbi:MAG: phosphosulfolactate synthase [Armatimonadota bacterium]|nr:phosphosulfolactate synthase [Armatimonadota bacterium]